MSQHEDDGYDVPIAVVAGGHDDGMTLSWSPFSSNNTPQQQQPRQLTPLPTFSTASSSSIPMVAPPPPSLGAASRIPAVHRTIPSSSSRRRTASTSTTKASRNHRHSSNNNNNSNNPNSHMAAAVFYGECSKEGIPPTAAERAAMDVNGQYRRWWVDAVASGTTAEDATTSSNSRRRRRSSTSTSTTSVGRKRPREQQHSHHYQNEEDRNVIHRVSQRQQEQGGGYAFPSAVIDPVSTNTTTGNNNNNTGNSRRLLASSVVIDGKKVPISLPSSAAAAEAFVSQNYKTNDEELRKQAQTRIRNTKAQLLAILKENGGNASTDDAKAKLQILHDYYLTTERDARSTHSNSNNNNKSHALLNNDNNNKNNNNNIDANDILAGNWLALSQPAYNGCLGTNVHHHYQYTLGRMSFDMYRPTTLVCSIQANFSSIHGIDDPAGIPSYVPRRLRAEVQKCRNRATHARYNNNNSSSMSMNSSQHSHVSSSNNSVESHSRSGSMSAGSTLRSYTIAVALTIEADQSQTTTSKDTNTTSTHSDNHDKQPPVISRPIRGIMKNNGYMLPDPKVPNRLSIWFTEGTLEVNDLESDLEEWKRIFSAQKPKLGLYDRASILAARLLLGANMPDTMDDDGTMSYSLTRPIGGHGFAYVDVLYVDDDLRVLRGHGGQVYVCARLAETVAGADDDDDDSVDAG